MKFCASSVRSSVRVLALTLFSGLSVAAAAQPAHAATLAGWEMNALPGGNNNFGASPYAPTTGDANLTVVGWTRGSAAQARHLAGHRVEERG
jgi:hypothetical protein